MGLFLSDFDKKKLGECNLKIWLMYVHSSRNWVLQIWYALRKKNNNDALFSIGILTETEVCKLPVDLE